MERGDPDRPPKRDWRVDMLVEDRDRSRQHDSRHDATSLPRAHGLPDPRMERSRSPEPGPVAGLLGFLSASPAADNASQSASLLQPSFGSSALEEAAGRWLQQTFLAESDQRSLKGDLRSYTKHPCFLPEGLTLDVHGTVLGVSRAVDVFHGMLLILYTVAQVIQMLSSADRRLGNHPSLVLCNIASFLCYPGLMLACGYTSYEKFLREWPDPGTYSSRELLSAILLPLVSGWICSFAFCFLGPQLDWRAPAEAMKQVLLFGSGKPEGAEILLACGVNLAIVFVVWRPVAGVLHTVKARVWHDALALALALSPLALMFCFKTLSLGEERSGLLAVLPYLHVHLGILAAACWDRFLSQLQPVGFQTVTESIHLIPWQVFKGWLLFITAAWWAAFVLFIPLGQVVLSHDLSSPVRSPLGLLDNPPLGLPSPLWLLAAVWPLAICMALGALIVTIRQLSTVVRWMDLELAHMGQNLLYYMVVVHIFLASLPRASPRASFARCLLGAASILAASRFLHFMAGLSQKAARI